MNDINRMVSVPCELLEQALDAAAAVGMQDVADELNRILTPSGSVFSEDKIDGWNNRAQPFAQVTPAALMLAMENLAVMASASDHPPVYPPASVRQVPLVMLGGVCLRVSYSGLKWYHDQLIDGRWEPLSVDEFEALLTEALRGSTQGSNP